MNIPRKILAHLLEWKTSPVRKPLILRGARQVGKTTIVREFSKTFDHYAELNLERDQDRALFENDDIDTILNSIYLVKGIAPEAGESVFLFIDEIQESPQAIRLLRYFYEEKPEIHVIAAGSLLEFALKEVSSFPVGRVSFLYMHPVNFEEYLEALKNEPAVKMLNNIPIADYAHNILLKLFHEYAIIGGMPEILSLYIDDHNIASLAKAYQDLWQAYKDDVEKYAQNNSFRNIIRHIIETAPYETDRIKFEGFGKSNYRSREVGEAFRALDMAKVIQLIYPAVSLEPPMLPDLKKRPRLQFLDTGMINQVLMLQGEMLLLHELDDFYRGRIIQHLVYQEVISAHLQVEYKPNFWVRESNDSNAEVDLIYRSGKYIIPIEIKSGKTGTLRSLHQFVDRAKHPYAIRIYSGKFNVENAITPAGKPYLLMNLPYYLGTKLPEYINWFTDNHSI